MSLMLQPALEDRGKITFHDDRGVVDAANKEFYERFPYPWPPMTFPCLEDPDFETVMLNQSIGDFTHRTIPATGRIWVAGCGTNQAIYTALRFPRAEVVGSDLSEVSLSVAETNAKTLGLSNLKLRQESLNAVEYSREFDYIICTGVIHHNAVPSTPLRNLARALHPNGVLELMVYNRFHRTFTTAFQEAVRVITGHTGNKFNHEEELAVAMAIAKSRAMSSNSRMTAYRDFPEARFADTLIQPVEHSYTVDSLSSLVAECGLEFILPCYDQFSMAKKAFWSLDFGEDELQRKLDRLPDSSRWQVVNLLLLDKSPMLWFYIGHSGRLSPGSYEDSTNRTFLNGIFFPSKTVLRNYVRDSNASYRRAGVGVPYPQKSPDELICRIVERADGRTTMREILGKLQIGPLTRKVVSDLRVQTTTSLCPYLRATG